MYQLVFTNNFTRKFEKLAGKDDRLRQKVKTALQLLVSNPRHPFLASHKVDARQYGKRWSSTATRDLRIIWDYPEGSDTRNVIYLLAIGGHSGKDKVYK